MAKQLLGKEVTAAMNEKIKGNVAKLQDKGITPTLGIIRVGERDDDISYERGATKRCETLGVAYEKFLLPQDVTEEELLAVKFQNRVNTAIMDCMKYGPDEVVSNLPMTADETQKASDIKASLDTYFYEITSQFLIGEKDIDNEWDNYLAELEKIGYKELLAAYQTAYDRTK